MDINSVASEMAGNFQVRSGVVTFSNLNFGVIGASVNLTGTYNLDGGALYFHGNLVMQAKLSQNNKRREIIFSEGIGSVFQREKLRNRPGD
jgi:hypothetical protein